MRHAPLLPQSPPYLLREGQVSVSLFPLLTAAQAAALLGVHPRTLARWARQQKIPCVRLGVALRFARRDLERFASARRTP